MIVESLHTPRAFCLCLFALLAGCSTLPEVDNTAPPSRDAPWPQLAPIEELRAEAQGFRLTDADGAALDARAASLRARAAALRRETR
jgi:hypothetical protein